VTSEGACGEIDTSWFRAFPDAQIRREVAAYFVKRLEITGPEYCQIGLDMNFDFFGADDKDMYVEQLNLLLKEKEKTGQLPAFQFAIPGVCELTEKRCRAMAQNTVARMHHLELDTGVLHVGRTFNFVIQESLKSMNISNAVLEASAEDVDDWSRYAKVLTNERDSLEDTLQPGDHLEKQQQAQIGDEGSQL
jgi:hypothetical protein